MWKAQAGRCALCGEPMLQNRFEAAHARIWAKRRATIDHIVPISKGGADQLENLQLAHANCNKIKGNRV
ncbi:MAG: HNH endonuclease [Pseudomonadota bacterium]